MSFDAAEKLAAMTSSRPVGWGPVRSYDWIAHHDRQRPAKVAIRDLGTGRVFTYGDLDRRIDAMAAYLTSLGIGRGDRVGVLAHNGVEYFDVQFACARTGAICVLLNWRLTVQRARVHPQRQLAEAAGARLDLHRGGEELQRRCGTATLLSIDSSGGPNPYEST
jgi:fatty-acyl-CoA synthase